MTETEDTHNDPEAELDDTRLRVEAPADGVFDLVRERYCMVQFETPGMDDVEVMQREYDWHREESFRLHGEEEARQYARLLVKDHEAFDPQILFPERLKELMVDE